MARQPSWLPVFRHFLSLIKITSKEMTEPAPMTLYRGQEMFLQNLSEGLGSDIHHFVNLKARQLGISTIMLAFDIFWLYVNPGLQGALIADTGDNKETFRQTITEMLESLPRGFKVPIKTHNRNALVLQNGSRLQYMSAGKGKNSGLGRSRALNYVHATECSSWGDQKGLDSLLAALAEENPNRLYVFESTALGFNLFYDMYKEAEENPLRMKAFFIGWWAKDIYRFKEGSLEYEKWWGQNPEFTEEEREKGQRVLDEFGWEITPEQWSWYRAKAFNRSTESICEEFPTTPEEAWQATGSPFFSSRRVSEDMQVCRGGALFKAYEIEVGESFTSLKPTQTLNASDPDLRVWEEPQASGKYVIGVDPAYGRSEDADRSIISVWRCFADKLVQVAEYATPMPETGQVAWVMAWLAGCYRDCIINLEISGPGGQVMMELKHLKQQINANMVKDIPIGLNVQRSLDTTRWYLWHRPDSMGSGFAYNWRTSWDNKLMAFNRLRDAYNTEQFIVRSVPLLNEMLTLVQDGDTIAASGRNKDDRVFAAALANYAWAEWVRAGMMADNRTFDREMAAQMKRDEIGGKVVDQIIPNFFKARAAEREDNEWRRILGDDA